MTKHFTRNTISADAWCAKCKKRTQHRVDGVKLGPCMVCITKLDELYEQRKCEQEHAQQQGLFEGIA